jgi:hypothetical protein
LLAGDVADGRTGGVFALERLARSPPPTRRVGTRHHLGDFLQAFSRLALIEAASRIIAADRLAEM